MARKIIIQEEGREDIVFENVGQFALVVQSINEIVKDHRLYSGSYDYLIGQTHFLHEDILETWRKQNG